jgi:hypothetical protein
LTGDQLEHLDEARKSIQDLASRFRAFAMNEDWPVRFIRLRGYDPTKASTGLFGFSNRIDIAGSEKAAYRKAIEELLRIPRHSRCGAWTTLTALPHTPQQQQQKTACR